MSSADSPGELATPQLTDKEWEQAERRRAVPVLVVHEAVRMQGDEELERPAQALAWSGVAAGLSMGASLIVEGVLRSRLPDAPWRPLLQHLGYPIGFLMLIVGRQQLFTENTVTAIVPLLSHRDWPTFWKVVKLWSVVLCANLVGAHIAAWTLSNTPIFAPDVRHAFDEIAREAIDVTFTTAILKGIVAGWLIAMMVWMLAAVRVSQLFIVLLMTYVVGISTLTHIIAGSIEALFLVFNGTISWWRFAGGYAAPTLLGNIIGGVSLVSVLNHAQVVAGQEQKQS